MAVDRTGSDAMSGAALQSGRGLRVVPDAPRAREREVVALREAGWLVSEIASSLGISRSRVHAVIERAGGVDRERALAARSGLQARRAKDRSREILDHYRQGADPRVIATELGLNRQAVERVVRDCSTGADRLTRARALACAQTPRFSDEQLLDGVVRVAFALGRVPTGAEYDRQATRIGLASLGTVVGRFDGWHTALHAAALNAPPQQRRSRWDQLACWRALESVAGQLGDPPRYRRYKELARGRDDFPSGNVVRDRLGLWPAIAAELTRRTSTGPNRIARVLRPAGIRPRASSRAPGHSRSGTPTRQARAELPIPRRRVRSFTDAELTAGIRAVAQRVGHTPTGGEYRRLAEPLGLASLATVYNRFGSWSGALTAAGYQRAAPARAYTKKWDLKACWTALESVSGQLGDRPSYRRYQQLAAGREDLPSGALLRQRLGPWSQIAAALSERNAAGAARRALLEGIHVAA